MHLQFLFKKYLEYEKSVGDEERVEYVKQKAMEYVENTLAWITPWSIVSFYIAMYRKQIVEGIWHANF